MTPLRLDLIQHDIITCRRCERLRSYCRHVAEVKKAAHRTDTYWGRPVPGFGDPRARVLVLGLAPAAHGANRTGRVFTGDGSGDFLMRAMHRAGFASIPTSRRADDGLELQDAYVAAAVRCAPPDNKPLPEEIRACHPHLAAELAALPAVGVIVALGRIAFEAALRLLAGRGVRLRPRPQFGHGSVYRFEGSPILIGSYHPSRQNTNTGRLTAGMLEAVFLDARAVIGDRGSPIIDHRSRLDHCPPRQMACIDRDGGSRHAEEPGATACGAYRLRPVSDCLRRRRRTAPRAPGGHDP